MLRSLLKQETARARQGWRALQDANRLVHGSWAPLQAGLYSLLGRLGKRVGVLGLPSLDMSPWQPSELFTVALVVISAVVAGHLREGPAASGCSWPLPHLQGYATHPPAAAAQAQPSPAPRKDLAALFTCGVCDTRVAKSFSRQAYDRGVVLVKCPSCQNVHVLADRLGWFGEPGSAESFLEAQGQEVRQKNFSADGTCELTAEDIEGWSKGKQVPGAT